MAKKCMMDRKKFEDEEHAAQQKIRTLYESRPNVQVNAEVTDKEVFAEDSYLRKDEYSFRDIPAMELSIDEILPYFDWRMFLAVWGIKYGGELPDDPIVEKTLAEGKSVIERFRIRHEVKVQIAAKFLDAMREGDDIVADSVRFRPGRRNSRPAGAQSVPRGFAQGWHWTNSGRLGRRREASSPCAFTKACLGSCAMP